MIDSWSRILQKDRKVPPGMKIGISDITGFNIIEFINDDCTLWHKYTLANDYSECYDIHGNRYYVSPDAINKPRMMWTGVEVDNDFYIYLKDINEDTEED